MILFAICLEPLLRHLEKLLLPDDEVGAFADDIGAVLSDLLTVAPRLLALFERFARITKLCLNHSKCVLVPLMPKVNWPDVRHSFSTAIPVWQTFSLQGLAEYLGFLVGADSVLPQWDKVSRKANDSILLWKKSMRDSFLTLLLPTSTFFLSSPS